MPTHILFVDDESNVLSGLRRMLRSQRREWTMHFASGGEEALSLMERETIDVIVSDMRMPGMDGAALLTRISEAYPHTVRLILSGQSDHERIFRAIGPAHQFLSKPCEAETLIETVSRACRLQSQLADESLRNVISQIGTLPSLPQLYRDLVGELESSDASLDRVGEIIGADLAMSAKVLQLVNSSFFGIPQHVNCPKHAVSLLGLSVIRPLALTAGAFARYEDSILLEFSLSDAIDHGLAVATTARAIAMAESPEAPYLIDDAFIAGMMHDIGKLVLASHLQSSYREAFSLVSRENLAHPEAEKAVFGTTHADVGAHLLDLWGLPNSIVEAVAFHHRPSESDATQFSPLTAVHAANVLRRSSESVGDAKHGTPWDLVHLETLNLSDRVKAWKKLLPQEALS
ncbi:MAG: response regulator [Planctomycetota bacterium]